MGLREVRGNRVFNACEVLKGGGKGKGKGGAETSTLSRGGEGKGRTSRVSFTRQGGDGEKKGSWLLFLHHCLWIRREGKGGEVRNNVNYFFSKTGGKSVVAELCFQGQRNRKSFSIPQSEGKRGGKGKEGGGGTSIFF